MLKNIVPCTRQTIATHASIIFSFVSRLSKRCQSNNNIAVLNVSTNDFISPYSCRNSAINNNSAYQIAYVCRFATSRVDSHAHISHGLQKFFRSLNYRLNNFARNQPFVPAYCRRQKNVVRNTRTK